MTEQPFPYLEEALISAIHSCLGTTVYYLTKNKDAYFAHLYQLGATTVKKRDNKEPREIDISRITKEYRNKYNNRIKQINKCVSITDSLLSDESLEVDEMYSDAICKAFPKQDMYATIVLCYATSAAIKDICEPYINDPRYTNSRIHHYYKLYKPILPYDIVSTYTYFEGKNLQHAVDVMYSAIIEVYKSIKEA
jgi:hypothetical protein